MNYPTTIFQKYSPNTHWLMLVLCTLWFSSLGAQDSVLECSKTNPEGAKAPIPTIANLQSDFSKNSKLYVSLGALKYAINSGSVILIDTRLKASFDSYHMHGAINLPLYALENKSFLKNKKLVLINQGRRYAQLEKKVTLLTGLGFTDVKILDGGMDYWIAQEQAHQSTPQSMIIDPLDVIAEANEWLVIDVRSQPSALAISFKHHRHFAYTDSRRVGEFIDSSIKGRALISNVLLISDQVGEAKRIASSRPSTIRANLYYLEHGLSSLTKRVYQQLAILKSKDSQRSQTTCG